jgi:hypothetical protein
MRADGSNSGLRNGRGFRHIPVFRRAPAYPSLKGVAKSKDCCQFFDAATPLLRSTMFLVAPLDFQLRLSANRRRQSGVNAGLWKPHFPTASRLMRAVALIGQERTSKIILNGVSVARRKRLNPASVTT